MKKRKHFEIKLKWTGQFEEFCILLVSPVSPVEVSGEICFAFSAKHYDGEWRQLLAMQEKAMQNVFKLVLTFVG